MPPLYHKNPHGGDRTPQLTTDIGTLASMPHVYPPEPLKPHSFDTPEPRETTPSPDELNRVIDAIVSTWDDNRNRESLALDGRYGESYLTTGPRRTRLCADHRKHTTP